MDEIIAFLILIGIAVLIMPIIALVIASKASGRVKEMQTRIHELEQKLTYRKPVETPTKEAAATEIPPRRTQVADPVFGFNPSTPVEIPAATTVAPPPIPSSPAPVATPAPTPIAMSEPMPPPAEPAIQTPSTPAFSLEHFMGVKLFAWLGGIAMFFGVIYFVKYAFENNIITEAGRIALGYVTGVGLLVGGLWTHRKADYLILAHSLIATGVLVLYGVTYAAHALYQFPMFDQKLTFLLMSLITAAAFLIAIRLNAQVVAALGMLGGFLSPILISTGVDHPFGLFGYIALLDIGILATTRIKDWKNLPAAAAIGTIIIQIGWYVKFFHSGAYYQGTGTLIPMGIFAFFTALFTLVAWDNKRRRSEDTIPTASAYALALVAIIFGFTLLSHASIAQRPFVLYGFMFLINVAMLAISTFERRFSMAHLVAAILTFIHLAIWNEKFLNTELMTSGLVIYLVFGAIHACYPLVRPRLTDLDAHPLSVRFSPWLAPITLLLMFLTVQAHHDAPLLLWAAVLLIDALVIGIAFKTRGTAPIIGSLVLTFLIAWSWLDNLPAVTQSLTPLLVVIVAFGGLFATTGIWWIRMAAGALTTKDPSQKIDFTSPELLTILSAVLPYGMLILMLHKLPLTDPSPIFGVTLLLSFLLLGLMLIANRPLLVPAALICTLAVEHAWFTERFSSNTPWVTFGWFLGFYIIFTAFPFVFRKACEKQITPWAGSAISGIGHFLLIHLLVRQSFSNTMGDYMGAVPFAFAIPSILALRSLMRGFYAMDTTRQRQLAWIGGVALLFITLIFPIQLSRQWITVSWALEGAALIWLFRKVPHAGLKWTALALLATAFVRLTLNQAVFSSYPRSGTAILNWHLYTYGIVIASSIAAAKLIPCDHQKFRNINLSGILYGFAGILLFLLLNIEIADFFTPEDQRFITFHFGGNFARDMTYSIAWGLFSLGLLGIGIWKRIGIPRFIAIALLAITLIKVFFYDLSQIGSVYRIGALMGIAIIAFVASFLYQRFYSQSRES